MYLSTHVKQQYIAYKHDLVNVVVNNLLYARYKLVYL
jgi:hypothetical protein